MPRIPINLDDVEGGFVILPDGLFHVEIQESTKVKRSQKGAYILWLGKILEGEFEGKMVSWSTSLQEQALWNLKNLLETLEIEWDESGFDLEDAFGKELFVHNTSGGEYNGQPRNTIDAYYTIEQAQHLDEDE